ncbi:hypothetical protein [Caenimonas aquaedulcis]|uniref:Lipoprotein n=1 Tax=Caenimonas aquaedulcis TaxID=2793270 RepID=A0A931MIV5_9BURK|nr:hypothetical protein [Caenimonas aquaedulcis]MBG9390244.1 hypothetical protein [Caenimonas aquaedulcis]
MNTTGFVKATLAAAALAATCACAQPAAPQAGASAPWQAGPMGPGGRPGGGMMGPRGRAGPGYTFGWPMMSARERDEHRARMRGAQTYEACRQEFDEHRKLMEERARERGIRMRGPRGDACGGWKR